MSTEMKKINEMDPVCLPPLDVDAAVVMELRYLAECPPNGTWSDSDLLVQTYLYGDCVITHRTVGDTLPMPSDSPVYYYVKAALGRVRQNDNSVSSVTIKVRDVINGIGLTPASSSYESVRTAIARFSRLNVRIERPDGSVSEFRLFGFRFIDPGTVRIDFAPGYLEEIDADDRKVHYLALGHVIRLGGLATSLYAILQSRLFHTGQSDVSARKFCRSWLGEERGNDIPVSRAYSSYLVPRIKEIAEKTGWEIAVEKIGRADKSRYVFTSVTAMPQAFAVREQRLDDVQSDALAAANAVVMPEPVSAPVQTKAPAPTLSATVIAALPPEAAENNLVVSALASVTESEAMSVISYVNSKNPKSFVAYLTGITKNRSIKSLVSEIGTANKSVEAATEANYRYAIDTLIGADRESFLLMCRHRNVDPDDAIAWARSNGLIPADTTAE